MRISCEIVEGWGRKTHRGAVGHPAINFVASNPFAAPRILLDKWSKSP